MKKLLLATIALATVAAATKAKKNNNKDVDYKRMIRELTYFIHHEATGDKVRAPLD